jgi:hypothetical protein
VPLLLLGALLTAHTQPPPDVDPLDLDAKAFYHAAQTLGPLLFLDSEHMPASCRLWIYLGSGGMELPDTDGA